MTKTMQEALNVFLGFVPWSETHHVDTIRTGIAELESRCEAAEAITDAQVERVGSAFYVYWNQVNKNSKDAYKKKVRTALESAIAHAAPEGE